jgi:acyl-coenzyme A synthetase/AMP-(fatty) acid ligase
MVLLRPGRLGYGAPARRAPRCGHDGGEDLPPSGIGPDDPFAVVFSSGTTCRPKGCLHTFNTYCASARLMGEAYHCTDTDVQFGPSSPTARGW